MKRPVSYWVQEIWRAHTQRSQIDWVCHDVYSSTSLGVASSVMGILFTSTWVGLFSFFSLSSCFKYRGWKSGGPVREWTIIFMNLHKNRVQACCGGQQKIHSLRKAGLAAFCALAHPRRASHYYSRTTSVCFMPGLRAMAQTKTGQQQVWREGFSCRQKRGRNFAGCTKQRAVKSDLPKVHNDLLRGRSSQLPKKQNKKRGKRNEKLDSPIAP